MASWALRVAASHSSVEIQSLRQLPCRHAMCNRIAAGFKRDIWDFDDYMDMWITFSKRTPKPRSRSRKSTLDAAGGA